MTDSFWKKQGLIGSSKERESVASLSSCTRKNLHDCSTSRKNVNTGRLDLVFFQNPRENNLLTSNLELLTVPDFFNKELYSPISVPSSYLELIFRLHKTLAIVTTLQ